MSSNEKNIRKKPVTGKHFRGEQHIQSGMVKIVVGKPTPGI